MKKYFLQTFGCEMNKADSEKINMVLLQSGLFKVNDYKEADLVIFNTCSVRQKGENRVFGIVREILKENKNREKLGINKKIITGITGCMVRKTGLNKKYLNENILRNVAKKIEYISDSNGIFNNDDKLFPKLLNLDFTLRIEEVKFLPFILTHIYNEKIGNDDKFDDYLKLAQLRENNFQASIIIQTGCDNYCSFCIVPYTRGKEISRDENDIISEVNKISNSNVKEISLIGQNVNSYGKQFVDKKMWNEEKSKWQIISPPSGSPFSKRRKILNLSFEKDEIVGKADGFISPFRKLLNKLDETSGIDRIRFTSSNPHDMTKDILDAHFELKKTCNYLHFALQSGNDEILKKMNRKHTYEDFKKQVLYLRNIDPFFSISTDIIVGFSGETEEMFNDTVKAIKELELDFVYIARYSVRSGTIASKIYPDDVPDNIKAERWHILNSVLEENVKKRGEKMIGKIEEILISGEKEGQFFGRTRNFKEVFFSKHILNSSLIGGPGRVYNIGDIVKVKITGINDWVLIGEIESN